MCHVTCHMSLVTCHMEIFSLQCVEVSLLMVCYQQRLSGLVFRQFLSKTRLHTIFTYLGLWWSVLGHEQKQIDENLFSKRLE